MKVVAFGGLLLEVLANYQWKNSLNEENYIVSR